VGPLNKEKKALQVKHLGWIGVRERGEHAQNRLFVKAKHRQKKWSGKLSKKGKEQGGIQSPSKGEDSAGEGGG